MSSNDDDAGVGDAPSLVLPVQHVVGRARAGRKLAAALCLMLVLLPILLVVVPWQQNVPGSGRVTALDPLDRVQTIPAPVSGRLISLSVQEGSVVERGMELAVMEDLDPNFSLRLTDLTEYAQKKVDAANDELLSLERQLIQLEEARASAVRSAQAEFHAATQKVLEAEQKELAEEAKAENARQIYDRQVRLIPSGAISIEALQEAEAKYKSAQAAVKGARAAVEQARLSRNAKEEDIAKIDAEKQAKIDEVAGKERESEGKLQVAKKELTEAQSAEARQATRSIVAQQAGTILRVHAATNSDVITRSDPLIELIPHARDLAVEMWLRGIDAPLVEPGRKVRLQFEGWPAVQFAGWPSVAVGTFGGLVTQIDAQAAPDGRVRALVVQDPDEDPWPKRAILRQGIRASGWVQLDSVSTGYELWRLLNAFPPSVDSDAFALEAKGGSKSKDDGAKGDGKGGK